MEHPQTQNLFCMIISLSFYLINMNVYIYEHTDQKKFQISQKFCLFLSQKSSETAWKGQFLFKVKADSEFQPEEY